MANDRRDRLGGMVGRPGGGPPAPARPAAPLQPTVVRQRALLFAPPPAAAGAWLALLEAEGHDVLVAPDLDTAESLLRSAPVKLILAVAPALGAEVLLAWRAAAPEAEVHRVGGLLPLLQERVLPPLEHLEFSLRLTGALAGMLAAAHQLPPERPARLLALVDKAATHLAFSATDRQAVRYLALLQDVNQALAREAGADPTVPGAHQPTPGLRQQILTDFLRGLGAPFTLESTDPRPAAERPPTPPELAEAAARFLALQDRRDPDPVHALRKLALLEETDLHPAAVEAVISAAQGCTGRRRLTILLVDPDAPARRLLALRLANEGYTVHTAADGRGALEEVRREAPALVIAEAVLPALDGYALLDSLKREGRAVPFMFLSSRSDSLSVNKGLLLGAADYLGKPTNMEVLLTKVQMILAQPIEAAGVSSRLSLSDLAYAPTAAGYAFVSYDDLRPGVDLMGRFRIEADLGEGGMGKVFRARDEKLEELVVIKVMKSALTGDPKLLEHFKREIRLARKITHPGVVRIYDFWEAGPLSFVTMEHLEGCDLGAEIRRRKAFPVPVAVRVAIELFEALAAAHAVGVVHRDIKPHNVFLLPSGRIKVLDFGIAQGLDGSTQDGATLTASVLGTPEYMSPEQIVGDRVDGRTDLYSAGVLLYELLTGALPFRGQDRMSTATMRLHVRPQPPSTLNRAIPPAVDALVLGLLERDRGRRYADASAVVDALEDLRR